MFDIFINDGTKEIPKDDIVYIVGKDGIFLKKKVGLMESVAKVDRISILEDVSTSATLHVSKIPAVTFAKIVEFFKEVYEKYDSECIVMVHYNKKKKRYRIEVPEQEVSPASLDYKSEDAYKDYDVVGTIHSHCNMSAFHSGTDIHDEIDRDGIHITVGKIMNEYPQISAEIVANGSRFKVEPTDYIDGLGFKTWTTEDKSFWNPLTVVKNQNPKKMINNFGYKIKVEPKKRMFNRKWLDKVEEKTVDIETFSVPTAGAKIFPDITKIDRKVKEKIENGEFNPCEACPFREYKLDMMMDDLFEDLDNETWGDLDDEDITEIDENDFDME